MASKSARAALDYQLHNKSAKIWHGVLVKSSQSSEHLRQRRQQQAPTDEAKAFLL